VNQPKLLKVEVVVTFSGCPGDSERSLAPNWVTCPWPEDFLRVLDWQWDKKVIPYWKAEAKRAFEKRDKALEGSVDRTRRPGFPCSHGDQLLKVCPRSMFLLCSGRGVLALRR
jgi:hypothetical protein